MDELMFEALNKMVEIVGKGYPPEGQFEVFCMVSGKAISKPMHWTRIWREFDDCCYAGGSGNGIDVRRVGEAS